MVFLCPGASDAVNESKMLGVYKIKYRISIGGVCGSVRTLMGTDTRSANADKGSPLLCMFINSLSAL